MSFSKTLCSCVIHTNERSLAETFEVAAGSLRGRDHARAGRNNQDSFAYWTTEHMLLAVVADGCGSSRASEVGAHLGARLFLEACRRETLAAPFGDGTWERIRRTVVSDLARIAGALGGDGRQAIEDFFLFTLLGAAVTPDLTWIVAIGDGVATLNRARLPLGPFKDNAPPYLTYALLDLPQPAPRFDVLARVRTAEVDSIGIATDGAERCAAILEEVSRRDLCFANPDGVRRTLTLLDRECPLADDTTLIVIRRKRGALR